MLSQAGRRCPARASFTVRRRQSVDGALSTGMPRRGKTALGSRYFAGGFVSGSFLGPIGWLAAGLSANSSDVYIPSSLPSDWAPSDQSQ